MSTTTLSTCVSQKMRSHHMAFFAWKVTATFHQNRQLLARLSRRQMPISRQSRLLKLRWQLLVPS